MNKFEIGDDCYFFFADIGGNNWEEGDIIIYPCYMNLLKGKIVDKNIPNDYTYVYVRGCKKLANFAYDSNALFKSQKEAIEHMQERIIELEEKDLS